MAIDDDVMALLNGRPAEHFEIESSALVAYAPQHPFYAVPFSLFVNTARLPPDSALPLFDEGVRYVGTEKVRTLAELADAAVQSASTEVSREAEARRKLSNRLSSIVRLDLGEIDGVHKFSTKSIYERGTTKRPKAQNGLKVYSAEVQEPPPVMLPPDAQLLDYQPRFNQLVRARHLPAMFGLTQDEFAKVARDVLDAHKYTVPVSDGYRIGLELARTDEKRALRGLRELWYVDNLGQLPLEEKKKVMGRMNSDYAVQGFRSNGNALGRMDM